MELYLIRHTTPAVQRGLCYGQSDIDVTDAFAGEAAVIAQHLPPAVDAVYTSPLRRCARLAETLFPQQVLRRENSLMEINCGRWELQHWDEIPEQEINGWIDNVIDVPYPGGESYGDLHRRVTQCFDTLAAQQPLAALVTHGGVLRSIMAHITGTPLHEAFGKFKLFYGCVIHLRHDGAAWNYTVLSNIPHEREQHRPTKK